MEDGWQTLGTVAPTDLGEVRRVLHRGAILVAAVGKDLVVEEADGGHKSLVYEARLGGLAGRIVPAPRPFRAVLAIADLALQLVDAENRVLATHALGGTTLSAAATWLQEAVALQWPGAKPIEPQSYDDLARHPVADGAPIPDLPRTHLAECERYFANARVLLEAVRAEEVAASAIRIWPHHFDQAILLDEGTRADGEAQSIGVGFSPGEGSDGAPYVYVTPWPYPPAETLPAHDGPGVWQAAPFFGARLDAEALVASAADPWALALSFVRDAIATARDLLTD